MRENGWVRDVTGGAVLRVHARPGAKRSATCGLHGDAVAVRIAAKPVAGAANAALIGFLAEALGVPAGRISLELGTHGREKQVRIAGLTAHDVAARLGLAAVDTTGGGA